MLHHEQVIATINEKYANTIKPGKLRAMYVYGSRLYLNSKPDADFDILIVLDDFAHEKPTGEAFGDAVVQTDELVVNKLEAHLIATDMFIALVSQHYSVVLLSMWCDKQFILYEDAKMQHFRTHLFPKQMQIKKILFSFSKEGEVWCFTKAKRLWLIENDTYKSKKNIVHALRYIRFAHQIVQHKKIVDYTVANDTYKELMAEPFTTWEEFEAKYYPIFTYEKKMLNTMVEKRLELAKSTNVLQVIKEEGLEMLSWIYSAQITPLGDDLYKVKSDPALYKVTNVVLDSIGHGLVVDVKNIKIVAQFHRTIPTVPIYVNLSQTVRVLQPLNSIDWNTCTITKKVNGTCVCLYYKDKWRVSSHKDFSEHAALTANISCVTVPELFWAIWNKKQYVLPTDTSASYLFELTEDCQLLMHGCYNSTGIVPFDSLPYDKVPIIPISHFTSSTSDPIAVVRSIINKLNDGASWDPYLSSGIIVTTPAMQMFKIESAFAYFISDLRIWDISVVTGRPFGGVDSQFNTRVILELLRYFDPPASNADQLYMDKYKPLFANMYKQMKKNFASMCAFVDQFFASCSQVHHDKKQYASFINANFVLKQKSLLFGMRELQCNNSRAVLRPVFLECEPRGNKNIIYEADFTLIANMFDSFVKYKQANTS